MPIKNWDAPGPGALLFNNSPIHTALSMWLSILCFAVCVKVTDAEMGVQFCSGSDLPPEVVSEPQQRTAGVCVNGRAGSAEHGCVSLMVFTVRHRLQPTSDMTGTPPPPTHTHKVTDKINN